MILRPAKLKDYTSVLFWRMSLLEQHRQYMGFFKDGIKMKLLEYIFMLLNRSLFVMQDIDGSKIGYVYVTVYKSSNQKIQSHDYMMIEELYIIPSMQRKGFGRSCINELTKLAKTKHCKYICVNCYVKNTEALSFYKSCGMNELHTRFIKDVS